MREKVGENKETLQLSKSEAKKALGDSWYTTLKTIDDFSMLSLEKQEEYLKVFDRQVELFGNEGNPVFLPFNILKVVYNDGTKDWVNTSQFYGYKKVGQHAFLIVDLQNMELALQQAETFYRVEVLERELEGVVVKPDIVQRGVAPYLKVRNTNYLTLVYGYDWLSEQKTKKLLSQKKIGRKLQVSIDEWETGQKMLNIQYKDIEENNNDFLQCAAKFIVEEKQERELDPRL
jgi:hypothetical protein